MIDPSLAMGQASQNRAGFMQVNANITVDIDLPADEQDRFIDEFNRRFPLCDTVLHETTLTSSFLFQADDAER